MFIAGVVTASVALGGEAVRHRTIVFRSSGARITVDEYASRAAAHATSAVVILYGSGGLRSTAFPYAAQARAFVGGVRLVYLPHYLDVTHGSADEPQRQYGTWAQTVRDALHEIRSHNGIPINRTFIIGYSLGGSVALVLGASEPQLAGIVVWSGSLPDAYRDVRRLPPLLIIHGARDSVMPEYNARQLATLCVLRQFSCRLNMYPEEGHAFSKAGVAAADSQIRTFLDSICDTIGAR